MKGKLSIRGFVAVSSLAGAVVLLNGCGQQVEGDGALASAEQSPLTQGQVLPTGGVCSPTGAHGKHATASCAACHDCGGVLQFSATGPAVAAGKPAPSFDATAKTCSNVACHSVAAGEYYYWSMDGSGEMVLASVSYGGGAAQTTPSWYTTGGSTGCAACHPLPASGYAWHSGLHGNPWANSTHNSCQTCHPDAIGYTNTSGVVTSVALSTATNCGPQRNQPCAAGHADGVLTVLPLWNSSCWGCH